MVIDIISLTATPKSVPLIVISVPPWYGPEFGLTCSININYLPHCSVVHTIVICGEGQVLLVVVNVLPSEQDSIITQLVKLLHHPQSSINVFKTDKHDEHPPAKAEQLYSITVTGKCSSNNYVQCKHQLPFRRSTLVSRSYTTSGPVHLIITLASLT